MRVAQQVGRAIKKAFDPARVGLIIAGFEVPHLHLHVFAVNGPGDFDFRQARSATDGELGAAGARLRAAVGTEAARDEVEPGAPTPDAGRSSDHPVRAWVSAGPGEWKRLAGMSGLVACVAGVAAPNAPWQGAQPS